MIKGIVKNGKMTNCGHFRMPKTLEKRLCAVMTAVALIFLSACVSGTSGYLESDSSVSVYRLAAPATASGGELIRAERISVPAGEDSLSYVVSRLFSPPETEGVRSPFPEGLAVISYVVENREITVNVTEEYFALTDMDKTIADYCITLTLCSLAGIDIVSIYVEGEPVNLGMTADDVVVYQAGTDPQERQVRLYFIDLGGRHLLTETRTYTTGGNASIESHIIEELLYGPTDMERMYSAIPAGTRLLSAETIDGVCVIDLSFEFLIAPPSNAVEEYLTIYSIVNSVSSLSGVDEVKITVEGNDVGLWLHCSLAEAFVRNDNIIGPVNTSRGEADINLTIAHIDKEHVVILPYIITLSSHSSMEYAVIAALFSETARQGYANIFRDIDDVISVTTKNTICTVDLRAGFFSGFENQRARLIALDCIVNSLIALDGITTVQFRIDGGTATYNGSYYSPKSSINEDIIVG